MTETALAIASPVFTVAGELSRDLARDCVLLEVEEGTQGLRTLRAQFLAVGYGLNGPDSGFWYLDGRTLDFGKSLSVAVGPDTAQRVVFDGVISGLEVVFEDGSPPVVAVYAEDALMRLRMTRRMRTYLKRTDAQIAAQIATDHGLDARAVAEGPQNDVVQQVNQSDLAFLRERARRIQAELWCEGQILHFASRSQRSGTRLALTQGDDLLSVRILADLAHQRSEALVTGYDPSLVDVIEERAGPEVIAAEVDRGRTGPDVVRAALGPGPTIRVREAPRNGAEARAWAQAEMLRRSRGFVTATGVTRGTPDMTVASVLTLADVGKPFEGDGYYVTRLRHTFDHTAGLRTHFEAQRPSLNEVA